MKNRQSALDRLALWILRETLPPSVRESVAGDLEEERNELGAGRLWFLAQTGCLASRYLGHRAWVAISRRWTGRTKPGLENHEGDGIMETLWNDARFGARMLLKSPLFTIVSVLTLALGIGANTAIFSLVNAVFLQPLPLADSDRLLSITGLNDSGRRTRISYPDFEDLRREAKLVEGYSAFAPQSVNLTGREEPRRVRGGFVSDDFFKVVGVEPALGRGFTPGVDDTDGAERVCVVQHETWRSVFGADPEFLGKTLTLNNEPFTVVGILPAGFRFPFDEVEVWIPHHYWPVFQGAVREGWINSRSTGLVGGIARLADGVTVERAENEMKTIMAGLASEYKEGGEKRSVALTPLRDGVIRDVQQPVLVLLAAVAFVLLIACANVANLMLSRAAARHRELATRAALGAGRRRLMAQLLTETGLLWIAGGAAGFFTGVWVLRLLLAAAPGDLPGGIVPSLDTSVLIFSFGLTALTGVFFGLIPALRFSSPDVVQELKEGGRGGTEGGRRTRLRGALVVAQVALTLVLLVGSGLLLRSFGRLLSVDVGFQPEKLLTMEYRLPQNKYPEGSQQWEFHRQVVERVQAVPGVQSAGVIRALPFSGNGGSIPFEVPGHPVEPGSEPPRARINTVDNYALNALGVTLLRGRGFDSRDQAGTPPVAIISRLLADRYFPDLDPIGRQIRVLDDPPMDATIVGVVGDVKQYNLDEPELPGIYAPQAQHPHIFNTLVVRTSGDPMSLAEPVRAAVWSVDKDQPVWKIRTVEFLIERSLGLPRFLVQLMAVYAGLALLLAAVGIYGVMSYTMTQRTHEIGVRMALGALPRDVLGLALRRGLRLTAIGLGIGLLGSLAMGKAVESLLFDISAWDPLTLCAVVALMVSVSLLASYLPSRRATRIDPLVALRYE